MNPSCSHYPDTLSLKSFALFALGLLSRSREGKGVNSDLQDKLNLIGTTLGEKKSQELANETERLQDGRMPIA